jgi:hypothetical protein
LPPKTIGHVNGSCSADPPRKKKKESKIDAVAARGKRLSVSPSLSVSALLERMGRRRRRRPDPPPTDISSDNRTAAAETNLSSRYRRVLGPFVISRARWRRRRFPKSGGEKKAISLMERNANSCDYETQQSFLSAKTSL